MTGKRDSNGRRLSVLDGKDERFIESVIHNSSVSRIHDSQEERTPLKDRNLLPR